MADNHWKDMPQQTDMVTYTPSKDEPNIYSKYFDSKGTINQNYCTIIIKSHLYTSIS